VDATPDGPDPDTLRRAVAGEPRAVTDVLRSVRPFAVRYCRARMHAPLPGATVEDVAQQVCLALLTAPEHRALLADELRRLGPAPAG
jgi:RNA polymerase sigma-70 factor (ECF subfamily)